MPGTEWKRRDVLKTLAAAVAAGVPALNAEAVAQRRVGIIGGGMAGVSLAWLLDGACRVDLIEAGETVGGNIRGVEVELDGHAFVVDMGAQYFHPGPYPLYAALLTHLGLHSESAAPSASHAFPASITVMAEGETTPRFVSPVLPDRTWPLLAPWNTAGIAAFGTAFPAAKWREVFRASWMLTLEDWLPTLGLTQAQWEGMLLPWAASLFSGSIEQARGLSARAAMIFAAKALPPLPWDPVLYYALTPGMGEALRRMLEQRRTVEIRTGARVEHVMREADGTFHIACGGGCSIVVDDLVLACSRPETLRLLQDLSGTSGQQEALREIEFHDARLALHADAAYVPPSPFLWSFLNCHVREAYCEASMWMAPVLAGPPLTTAAKLWKSWVTHRDLPGQVLHEAHFAHMLPTPATIRAQAALRLLQGRDGIWFAGGYTRPYDSQETALRSALGVALGLQITTARARAMLESAAV
jgi:predicted NAD/FAD-binding protein